MNLDRRELLFGLGGGACGLALSPVPWKLLDDASIWTQHRRALPLPATGEVTYAPAACTLCPGGCALRVRRVGGRPVSAVAERKHPLGGGGCPVGLTLHQLAYHPLRLASPARSVSGRLQPVTLAEAVGAIAAAARASARAGRAVMVVDRRPGRVVSQAWCELLAGLPGGLYATVPGEDGTLAALQGALAQPGPLGIDLERTRTVVSFGAPLLDGWGRPGRVVAARRALRVVQLDSWRSPTASLADEWLAVAPDGFGPLALALAHEVVRQSASGVGDEVRRALEPFAPARVSARVGVESSRIEALAGGLLAGAPALAIGGGEPGAGPLAVDVESAIALLNAVLGSVGHEGGIVPRRPLPDVSSPAGETTIARLRDVTPGSVGLAILDAADDGRCLPWPLVARTLAKDALVVSLSPFDGTPDVPAGLVVPSPAPLEAWDEVLPSADAAQASYAVSAPVLARPERTTDALQLIAALAQALAAPFPGGTHEERLRRRAAAIHATARGRFLAREAGGSYVEAAPADAVGAWDALAAGGCWIDAGLAPAAALARVPLPSAAALARWQEPPRAEDGLALVAFAARATVGATPVSPVLSKLFQETDLRASARTAAVHPGTAEILGLREGRRVWVESEAAARVLAELRFDALLPPGRVALAAGPAPARLRPGAATRLLAGALPLLTIDEEGTWRGTRVRVREA